MMLPCHRIVAIHLRDVVADDVDVTTSEVLIGRMSETKYAVTHRITSLVGSIGRGHGCGHGCGHGHGHDDDDDDDGGVSE